MEQPLHQAIVYGQDLLLNCSVINQTSGTRQGLVVRWHLNNSPIRSNSSVFSNGTLLVPTVTASDEGNYTCHIYDDNSTLLLTSRYARVRHACKYHEAYRREYKKIIMETIVLWRSSEGSGHL